jgi:tRNA threonylcarbamoyladenosine biosynthesis protein TsaB
VLLAIETSTRAGSVALVEGEAILGHAELGGERDHGRTLAVEVERLLGGGLERLDGFALGIGPGSFTGLRIGLAFVKGLALAVPRPVVPMSSLTVIALGIAEAGALDARPLLVVVDARGGEVYAALFSAAGVTDPRLPEGLYAPAEVDCAIDGLDRLVVAGDAGPLLGPSGSAHREAAPQALWTPDARVLGRHAGPVLAAGGGVEAIDLEPTYLQRSGAERNAGDRNPSVTRPTPSR